jgi:hypothetical protein
MQNSIGAVGKIGLTLSLAPAVTQGTVNIGRARFNVPMGFANGILIA